MKKKILLFIPIFYFNYAFSQHQYFIDQANSNSSYIISEDSTLYVFGYNTFGQLGNEQTANSNVPSLNNNSNFFKKSVSGAGGELHGSLLNKNGNIDLKSN